MAYLYTWTTSDFSMELGETATITLNYVPKDPTNQQIVEDIPIFEDDVQIGTTTTNTYEYTPTNNGIHTLHYFNTIECSPLTVTVTEGSAASSNDTTTLNGALETLGETLANNLESMGVTASASDGLTTLANKILLISSSSTRKLFYKITDDYDLFSAIPLNFWGDSEEHIDDSANGTVSFENHSIASIGNTIRRTVTGWSNHSIVNIIDYIEDIDMSQPFMFETDFYMQDGFEWPGLFIEDSTNFYQIYMWNNGGFYEKYGSDRTHRICVSKNKQYANRTWDVGEIEDSEIINILDIHRLRIIFKNDKLTFELRGLASDFSEHLVYSYDMDVTNFNPTRLGLVFGYLGSLDGGGYVIVFNNVKVYQIG